MKRILLFLFVGLIALLGSQAPILAAMNIRQNDDGTADWVGRAAESPLFANCVGSIQLQQPIELNLGLQTHMFVSPITNALLRNVQVIAGHNYAATVTQATVRFYLGMVNGVPNTTHPLTYRSQNSNVATAVEMVLGPLFNRGRVFVLSSPQEAGPFQSQVRLVSHTLMRNDPIFVQVDGRLGTTVRTSAPMLITLCPR